MGTVRAAGISSVSVHTAAGRTLGEWFAFLEAKGPYALAHSEIAVLVQGHWSEALTRRKQTHNCA